LELRKEKVIMKFNLKNRPKAKYPHNSTTEKWFRGFEKELREYKKQFVSAQEMIKEILGE